MKRIFILLSFAFVGLSLSAQDIHFSQYYASPLTLNPALTGQFDGLWRVSAIYRDQWRTIQDQRDNTYMTPSVSVDFSLLKDKLRNSALGVGAAFTYDKVGPFNTMNVGLSTAYHLGLDKAGKYHISVGLQGLYINRKIDEFDFTFSDEIIGNKDISFDDVVSTDAIHSFDLGAGLMADAKLLDNFVLYGGYSLNHILTPTDDFIANTIGDEDSKIPMRHVANIGAEIDINKFVVIPGVLFQTAANTNEINFGSMLGYKLNETVGKRSTLFFGLWSRWHIDDLKDPLSLALIPKIGFDYENFRVSGAFDIGLGQITDDAVQATNVGSIPTAFEIALNYFGQGSTPVPPKTYLFNPRF